MVLHGEQTIDGDRLVAKDQRTLRQVMRDLTVGQAADVAHRDRDVVLYQGHLN